MRLGWVWCIRRARRDVVTTRRWLSTPSKVPTQVDLLRTRNIGIIAHIDAGKTTTTERMLYYSGYTRRIGDVDEGSTVTDFLPAERARGITIQSAAITFHWPPFSSQSQASPSSVLPRSSITHNINLIDTPGHADFTFEVLRSLRVLDGAVCILDGVAGVEAQTEKVWTQAGHYQIPRIIYVNKLDRVGATFATTVKEIGMRLHGWPAVCQIPWWKDGQDQFVGVGDVVDLRGLLWKDGSDGKEIQTLAVEDLENIDPNFAAEIKKARVALVELLSEHDENMVELFLEHDEKHLAIPAPEITESLRKVVLQSPQQVIPVFAGASFRNIGVQPLLNAVVDLLPAPTERPDPEISLAGQKSTLKQLLSGKASASQPSAPAESKQKKAVASSTALLQNLQGCALAFKVVNDSKRGVLVYIRTYSGSIDRGSSIFNTNLNVTERIPRLLKMYASDAVEVESIPAGQIGVIMGLKFARTGDTLISYKGANPKVGPPAPINSLQLRPINVPPPVFFTSIEPNSLSEEKHVSDTLALLLREDPSLNLSVDDESGQTHLAGMGELHLEIARDRLLEDFKAKARTGKIEIGYRETVTTACETVTEHLERDVAGKFAKASCTASVLPLDGHTVTENSTDTFRTTFQIESNRLVINHPNLSNTEYQNGDLGLPTHLSLRIILSAIQAGASAALSRGPSHSFPVACTEVNITIDAASHIFPETTPAAISIATRQAVQAALRASNSSSAATLMEPVMLVTIFVNESSLGSVVQDISSARGGQVLSLDGDDTSSLASNSTFQEDLPAIDSAQIYTPPDPFQGSSGGSNASHGTSDPQRQIIARVPLKEMVGYLNHLRSLTGGRGTFVMQVDGFERMSGQRQKEVLEMMRGDII